MHDMEYERMDKAEATLWWYRGLHSRLLVELQAVKGKVLDAGCGTGGFVSLLRRVRPDLQITGLELAEVAARRAKAKSQTGIVRGSVNAIPFADETMDAIVSADVLCHAAVRVDEALLEFRRVLRPGGLLVINMPAYQWMHSAHDRHVMNERRTDARQLRDWLAAAGFQVNDTWYWNCLLFPLMAARRMLHRAVSPAASDTSVPPAWINSMLFACVSLEQRAVAKAPFGGSVFAISSRPKITP
jgi:ubiquinone/menaquinone biosynthesis C-methylase UbiE